jgi:NADH-quinone oxidoreductase subunit J
MTEAFVMGFGLLALVFAALVMTVRQPMRAALALIAHMVCLAGIFAALGVQVVALFQVLIYVGAVMVFMVYTIMLMDDRDPSYLAPFARWAKPGWVVAVLVSVPLLMLVGHDGTAAALPATAAAGAPPPFAFIAFSTAFIKHYWFHFELATVLLLIGLVAAWTAVQEAR